MNMVFNRAHSKIQPSVMPLNQPLPFSMEYNTEPPVISTGASRLDLNDKELSQ